MRGSDDTYASSNASTDGDDEEHDSASADDSDTYFGTTTELQRLFNKAVPEYARIERTRAHDLRLFEQLQKRHGQVVQNGAALQKQHDHAVQKGAALGQQLEDLKAKLAHSDVILADMHTCLAQFLKTIKPATESV